MHDYGFLYWHCSVDCCVNKVSYTRLKLKMLSIYKEVISTKPRNGGNVFLGGKLQIDAKNLNFEIFVDSALYMKSVSMPLIRSYTKCQVKVT